MFNIQKRISRPTPHSYFQLNNFAVRRSLLLDAPFDPDLPFYRGYRITRFKRDLLSRTRRTYRVPGAEGLHTPPPSLADWWFRMLIQGRDAGAYVALYKKRGIVSRILHVARFVRGQVCDWLAERRQPDRQRSPQHAMGHRVHTAVHRVRRGGRAGRPDFRFRAQLPAAHDQRALERARKTEALWRLDHRAQLGGATGGHVQFTRIIGAGLGVVDADAHVVVGSSGGAGSLGISSGGTTPKRTEHSPCGPS
jgi:hypothetical protein